MAGTHMNQESPTAQSLHLIPERVPKKVQTIDHVALRIWHTNPAALVITCLGKNPSLGWTGARLSPYIYFMPPADGIYEFQLVAEPPAGATPQVESTLTAELVWPHFPPYLTGIKVYAQDNAVITAIQPLASQKINTQAAAGFPSSHFQPAAQAPLTAIAILDNTGRHLQVYGLLHTFSNDDAVVVKSARPQVLHATEFDLHLAVIEGEGRQKGVYKPFSFQTTLAQPCHRVHIQVGQEEKITVAVERPAQLPQLWPQR